MEHKRSLSACKNCQSLSQQQPQLEYNLEAKDFVPDKWKTWDITSEIESVKIGQTTAWNLLSKKIDKKNHWRNENVLFQFKTM